MPRDAGQSSGVPLRGQDLARETPNLVHTFWIALMYVLLAPLAIAIAASPPVPDDGPHTPRPGTSRVAMEQSFEFLTTGNVAGLLPLARSSQSSDGSSFMTPSLHALPLAANLRSIDRDDP